MIPEIRLEADGLDPLDLNPTDGWVISAFDPGAPIIRENTYDQPSGDGSTDFTNWFGARNITLSVALSAASTEEVWVMRNQLRAFTSPRLRPILYFTWPGQVEQRFVIRGSNISDTIDNMDVAELTVQWVVPSGIAEAAVQKTRTFLVTGAGSDTGLVLPLVFPLIWNEAPVAGAATVDNIGTAPVWPLIRMYGPCDGPSLENETAGAVLTFDPSMTINAGDFLEVNAATRTVRYNGNENDSRYGDLDFVVSEWWPLLPGVNELRYEPSSHTDPAQAQVVWRHGWI